jgi:pimeloyl-ACP methyl ester carboxylesterase
MVTYNLQSEPPIRFTSQGHGKPVILLHGMAASFYDWKYLSPVLSEAGFHVLAPDLLGHGESGKPEEPEAYTFSKLYKSLEDWIIGFKLKDPLMLVGHSMGGLLALRFASLHSDRVRSLVLIDPYFDSNQLSPLKRLVNQKPELGKKALQAVPVWLINSLINLDFTTTDYYERDVRRQIAEDYKRASPNIFRFAATIPDINSHLEKVTVPTLVLWGKRDLTLDPSSFPQLVETLPNARGQEITKCGHQPHLARPEVVNKMILDFFNGGN